MSGVEVQTLMIPAATKASQPAETLMTEVPGTFSSSGSTTTALESEITPTLRRTPSTRKLFFSFEPQCPAGEFDTLNKRDSELKGNRIIALVVLGDFVRLLVYPEC